MVVARGKEEEEEEGPIRWVSSEASVALAAACVAAPKPAMGHGWTKTNATEIGCNPPRLNCCHSPHVRPYRLRRVYHYCVRYPFGFWYRSLQLLTVFGTPVAVVGVGVVCVVGVLAAVAVA